MSGSLGAAFSVDEASVKEATVAYFPLLSAVLTFRLCPWLREGFFVHFFCVKHTSYWQSACLSCLVIASIAILLCC